MSENGKSMDEKQWHDRVNDAANGAAERIFALPEQLRPRALAVVLAHFDRELKPLPSTGYKNSRYGRRYARQY
jgi:hypothetical protein